MVAKPIIDIMLIAPQEKMELAIAELAKLEYRHQGDLGIPGRECYDYLPSHIDLPIHHLYTSYPDHHQLHGLRAFRAFLGENEEWRGRLSQLKLELDEQFSSDRPLGAGRRRVCLEQAVEVVRPRLYERFLSQFDEAVAELEGIYRRLDLSSLPGAK